LQNRETGDRLIHRAVRRGMIGAPASAAHS
jgi:hypothetical protein